MGDCSTQAWNAPHGIDGAIHWNIGESELHYARFVNGEERNAEYIELDGVKYVPERTCYSDNEPVELYGDRFHVFRCSECGEKVDLCRNKRPKFCPNCGARVKEVDE